MANKLRRLLGRNLRYTQMNEQLDAAIQQLQGNTSPEAQMQLNALKQQRQNIDNLMAQPMTDAKYELYDDDGHYLGNNPQQTQQNAGGFTQTVVDGINHTAQGVSLGWSDEAFGAIGGVGRAAANGIMRSFGQNVNGESFADAWNKGYQEYRDFARQELQDGYQRNPVVSTVAEIGGAVISPVTPFRARGIRGETFGKIISHPKDIARTGWLNTVATGVVNGTGYTNQNSLGDYAENIAMSIGTNAIGNQLGNWAFGSGNNMYRAGRGTMNGIAASFPYGYDLYQRRKNGR